MAVRYAFPLPIGEGLDTAIFTLFNPNGYKLLNEFFMWEV